MMSLHDLREKLIGDGIAELRASGVDQHKIDGGIEGFRETRQLNTPQQFEACLSERRTIEFMMMDDHSPEGVEKYWRFHYGTLQIEFVYEVLKVGWNMSPQSARAIMKYADVVGVTA